jgi:tetratricopeptide (TPR) repeat protein
LVFSDAGEFDKAIADFTKAIQIDPQYASAWNSRGVAWREKEDYRKAIQDYDEALRIDRRYAEAYGNRGFALRRLGDYAPAIADYEQAIRLAPRLPSPHNDLAWLLATCPKEKFRNGQKAVEHANKACELTGFQKWEFVDTLAASYAEAGDFPNALQSAERCLKLAPEGERARLEQRLRLFEKKKPYRAES